MGKDSHEPQPGVSAEWEAPRRVLESIVMRHGSFRGIGLEVGRSTMFLWRQLRQNKGFNLVATGKVLDHLGVPARFFFEQVLDLCAPYDAAWVLEHFRERGGARRDPFLEAMDLRLAPLLEKKSFPGPRRWLGEIEALDESRHFDRLAEKSRLEKLGADLWLPAEAAAAENRGLERGQLADAGHLLLVWGAIQQSLGRLDDGVAAHLLGYRLAAAGGDAKVLGQFFCSAASLLADLGQPGAGLRFAERARRLFQRRRDRGLLTRAMLQIGRLLSELGRDEAARAEAAAVLRLAGKEAARIRALAWLQLGDLACRRERWRQALAMIRRARKYCRSGDDLEAMVGWREGLLLGRLGEPRAAAAALLPVMRSFHRRGLPLELARVAVDLVEILIRTGRGGEARLLARATTPLVEQLPAGQPSHREQALASWLDLLALILRGTGPPALEQAARVREILRGGARRARLEDPGR